MSTHNERKMQRTGNRVLIDIQRMERALSGPRITIPEDLKTREEIGAFIRGSAAAFEAMAASTPPPPQ